jgi:hypothetical protein
VTRGWIEERQVDLGPSIRSGSRVLGEFPLFTDRGVIPLVWAERAQSQEVRRLEEIRRAKEGDLKREKPIIALDVARYGQCKCVMGFRWGDAVESIDVWDHTSTMETTGKVAASSGERSVQAWWSWTSPVSVEVSSTGSWNWK